MGAKIVKYNTYRLVDNNSFELPVPFRFEVMKKDITVAEYEIIDSENIICNIVTKHKEDMLTTLRRPLTVSDIHFLFSCRVFQDFTPYTALMLERVGLKKYNVLDILYKTHGVIPYDNHWIRFEGETLDHETVALAFNNMMSEPLTQPTAPEPAASNDGPSVDEILSQHTIDISGIVSQNGNIQPPEDTENKLRTAVVFSHPEAEAEDINNNKMSESEIEALLMKSGVSEAPPMSEAEVDAMFAVNDAPAETSSGGMMSEEAIAALLAANAAPEAPAEPEPAPAETTTSGGMMSEEAIAALLAANAAPEAPAKPEPAPAPAETSTSGGMMSEDAIAALLAANAASETPAEPEPAPAPAETSTSGGMMSEDAIAALLAANAVPEAPAEPEPAPAPAETTTSGGMMSEDAIAALLAANSAPEAPAEPEPAPAPAETTTSGGVMSEDAIAALLSSMQDEAAK